MECNINPGFLAYNIFHSGSSCSPVSSLLSSRRSLLCSMQLVHTVVGQAGVGGRLKEQVRVMIYDAGFSAVL